jgi:hypothetical protein
VDCILRNYESRGERARCEDELRIEHSALVFVGVEQKLYRVYL